MPDTDAVLRIGEVSLRTDVSVATLRAWERRYGLLRPARTAGGHRLYSERDVARVRDMSRLMSEGWAASAAAREASGATTAPETDPDPERGAATLRQALTRAIESMDTAAINGVVDDTFARFEVAPALDQVLLPVVRDLGDGWEADAGVVAREHLATHALRPRLHRLIRTHGRDGSRALVAAAPEHEEHDFGLLAGAAIASDAGWRVHYLGARTPNSALSNAVAQVGAQAVLVATLFREHAESFLADLPELGSAVLVLGGEGFRADDLEHLDASARLHDGPLRELPRTLDAAVSRRPRSSD
ncbi:MAG: MerR family transcriptional regulator [Nitriliruptoraceae bacterium]